MNIPRDVMNGWEILFVEDDEMSIDVGKRILSHYGATVHVAVNGEEGLHLTRELMPRFVVTDLSMPVMDGWTMLEKIRSDETIAHIPVIALTAHAMVGDRERVLEAGFNSYLTKPLTPKDFMRELVNVLNDIPELDLGL